MQISRNTQIKYLSVIYSFSLALCVSISISYIIQLFYTPPNLEHSFLSIYQNKYHPEIEIPLYIGTIISTSLFGIMLYRFLYPKFTHANNYQLNIAIKIIHGLLTMGCLAFSSYFLYTLQNWSTKAWSTKPLDILLLVWVAFLLVIKVIQIWKKESRYSKNIIFTLFIKISTILIVCSPLYISTHDCINRSTSGSTLCQSDYLSMIAPVNDILGGKTLLVNSLSQYGSLMTYFLAALFNVIALSRDHFYHVLVISSISSYVLLFYALTRFTKRIFSSAAVVVTVHLFQYFIPTINIFAYGQITNFRFGFWIIIFAWLSYTQKYAPSKWIHIIEYVLVGIGILWGFDVGMYVLASYFAYTLTYNYIHFNYSPIINTLITTKTIITIFFVGVFSILLFTFLRSGVLPNWSQWYLLTSQFASGFELQKLHILGPQYLFYCVYFISALYCLTILVERHKNKTITKDLPIFVFIFTTGICQFLYFLGKSYYSYATVIVTPLGITIFLLMHLVHNHKMFVPFIAKATGLLTLTALFYFVLQSTIVSITQNSSDHRSYDDLNPKLENTIRQLNGATYEFLQNNKKITIISIYTADILLYTHTINMLDVNNFEILITYNQVERLRQQLNKLSPQYIYVDHVPTDERVAYIIQEAKKYYHVEKNLGVLDVWVKNKK